MTLTAYIAIIAPIVLITLYGPGNAAAQATCPEGFVALDRHCFHFVTDILRWDDAETNCEALGGYLAVLNDCSLFGDVVKHINAQGMADVNFWIGASDLAEEGNWLWVTGESVEMGVPYWGEVLGAPEPSGGESENCLNLHPSNRHYFHDGMCDAYIGSICQANPIVPLQL